MSKPELVNCRNKLLRAAASGNMEHLNEALQEISKAGIDINSEELCVKENTALMIAIAKEHIPAINVLIAAGMSLGKKFGQTALRYAIEMEKIGAAEVIIAASNRDIINLRDDENDNSALHQVAESFVKYSDKQHLIELLLAKGADPSRKNIYDKTAADIARELGQFECVTILNDAVRKDGLEKNAVSRKFRIESGIKSLFDPPYGAIFLEKFDSEEKLNPKKIEQILMLLDFIDPQFLDTRIAGHTAQLDVELVDEEMEERDEDEVLRVLVNFIATDFEKDDRDSLYESFFALIHEKFYNKKYSLGDVVKTNAQIVCGDRSEYYNEMVDGTPVVDQTKLLQEIRLVMSETISECKATLEQEFCEAVGVAFVEVDGGGGSKKRKVVKAHDRAAKIYRADGAAAGGGRDTEPRRISAEAMTSMMQFIQNLAAMEESDAILIKVKERFSLDSSMVPRSSVAQPVAVGMVADSRERSAGGGCGGGGGRGSHN